MSIRRRSFSLGTATAALALAALAPLPARAQALLDAPPASVPTSMMVAEGATGPRGPTLAASRAGATLPATTARPEQAAPARAPGDSRGFGQSQAMMIVGGAAVVTGLLIGGNGGGAIALGGAVVGLVGLYQYLR